MTVKTFTAPEGENINSETAIRKAEELQRGGYTIMSISRKNIPDNERDGDWTVSFQKTVGYEIVAVWGEGSQSVLPKLYDFVNTCP